MYSIILYRGQMLRAAPTKDACARTTWIPCSLVGVDVQHCNSQGMRLVPCTYTTALAVACLTTTTTTHFFGPTAMDALRNPTSIHSRLSVLSPLRHLHLPNYLPRYILYMQLYI